MKIKIKDELNIILPNGNMLSLTPYLWNEFKWTRGKNRYGISIGKYKWYLVAGHCEQNEKEFKKAILKLYDIKIVN